MKTPWQEMCVWANARKTTFWQSWQRAGAATSSWYSCPRKSRIKRKLRVDACLSQFLNKKQKLPSLSLLGRRITSLPYSACKIIEDEFRLEKSSFWDL